MNELRPPAIAKWLTMLAALSLLMVAAPAIAQVASLSQYSFSAGTCTGYDMSSGTTVMLGSGTDDGLAGPYNIGFTFYLGTTSYTQFKANSNGYMTLGTAANSSGCCGYTLTNLPAADRPAIAMFSKDLHNGTDGYVSYKLFGAAPNRVLVVRWRTREYPGSGSPTHTDMEVRLSETSNKIEMWYGTNSMSGTGGIGVIIDGSNYASVNSGVVSYTSASSSSFPSAGTCYSFTPCQANVAFTGNVPQGGTVNMAEGDTLLANLQVVRGSQGQRTPFTLYNGTQTLSACATRTYTYTIGGTYANDYTITPANGSLTNGSSTIPTITFRPSGTGVRDATLRVTDNAGLSRTYRLRGIGTTRIRWSGNIAQGGTTQVLSGDTLLNGTKVRFGTAGTFYPLTIENFNLDPLASPPANVTYTLNDPTGHYSITPMSAALTGGQTSAVAITFNALGDVGYQEARLTVNADGESRTYILRAFNAAPGGELFEGSRRITGNSPLFVNRTACVGTEILSIEVTAYNTGAGDFVVYGATVYETDTTLRQGTPPYPVLMKDGQPVQAIDYFVSSAPGILPKSANQGVDSIIIPERESRTFYVNMIPSRPGKRYGQIFFRTNAFNMSDPNINGVPTRGTLRSGVFGHGLGSSLSGATPGKRPGALVINETEVREERTTTAWLHNSGECDLYISRSSFRLESGDIDEFSFASVLPRTPIVGDNYVLAPGASDSVLVVFSPKTYGSRRATARLVTNDSTLGDAEVIERGVYYWDLYGEGSIGIEVRQAQLTPAVIGGPAGQGFVLLENTSAATVEIQRLTLNAGTSEIAEHSTRRWPAAMPLILQPGQKVQLWVELNATGTPGNRTAQIEVELKGGKIVTATASGYAGKREISVLPTATALFANAKVKVGELARQYVSITNIGTLPLQLDNPVLQETRPGDYRVSPLMRRIIEPGQTEIVEVTYTPQARGASTGKLTFASNATNGPQEVLLGGEGTATSMGGGGNGSSTAISKIDAVAGVAINAIAPNPARDQVQISYGLAEEGTVRVELYDMSGRQVRVLDAGVQTAGEHSAAVSVRGLSSGTYHCVIKQGDKATTYILQVLD